MKYDKKGKVKRSSLRIERVSLNGATVDEQGFIYENKPYCT